MKKSSLAAALALAPAPFPASAAPDPALQPLAFLAGHCWIGTIPGTADNDEHCFAWVYEGRCLRDRHVVRRGEKAVYEGDGRARATTPTKCCGNTRRTRGGCP